jgi:hypothetical protein
MKRTQHAGAFLIVEGHDDSRLYKRFVDPQQCHIVVALGKQTVVAGMDVLERDTFDGALGLVDCDFDFLDGRCPLSTNIIRGDSHDLETMLIRSGALEAVLHELGSPEKLERFEQASGASPRNWLIECARPLGYLRWNSLRMGWNLTFEGLQFSKFIDPRSLRLNHDALVSENRNHSHAWGISEEQLEAAAWPDMQDHDPWHVCCGHDMTELLRLALRRVWGSNDRLTTDLVERELRLAYGSEQFNRSFIFDVIREWEGRTGFHVLPRARADIPSDLG